MPLALDEGQIEYLVLFRGHRNKSVSSAAKSLINYFRDVCPELLPKKMRGRFSVTDETNNKSNFVYGAEKLNYDIDGIDLLKKVSKIDEDVNLAADRVLDDHDLKKIKILQLKEGVKRVDRHGFRDEDTAEDKSKQQALRQEYYYKTLELMEKKRIAEEMANQDSDESGYGEEGEQEMQEMYGEEGEHDMYGEEGEDELSDEASDEEDIPEVVPIQAQTINQEARYA